MLKTMKSVSERKSPMKDATVVWTVALFAGLAERSGVRAAEFEDGRDKMTAGELKRLLASRYPDAADLILGSFMACNRKYADDDAVISAGDELALLPPVSGGMAGAERDEPASAGERYAICREPLDPQRLLALVAHPDHGASLVFVGTTREWTGGKRTVTLEYEAYEPMALQTLRQIGEEIGGRWPGTLCAIWHRIGAVGIGEASVVIAVSSPHRADGYEASRYAIERLKQIVPIWKKEIYEDGTAWVGHQKGPWNPLAEA